MHVIVGLGNPGGQYAATRHNAGQWVVQAASQAWSIPLSHYPVGRVGKGDLESYPVCLAITETWMNLSGEAVSPLLSSLGCLPGQLIIVHDDLDLPQGRLRIKFDGGAGGHNGLRSIDTSLGTTAYWRVRMGIGRPSPGQNPADFVLEPIPPDQESIMEGMVESGVGALHCMVTRGPIDAMNQFNRRIIETQSDENS